MTITPSINYDSAGLLADIIPDKVWHYCSWCWRPIVFPMDVEQHSYARNVLESLGCMDYDHRSKQASYPLYIETELASYVFPYEDSITQVVILKSPPTFKSVMEAPKFQWEQVRDHLEAKDYIVIWTRKVLAIASSGNIDMYPRHPNLGLSFLD